MNDNNPRALDPAVFMRYPGASFGWVPPMQEVKVTAPRDTVVPVQQVKPQRQHSSDIPEWTVVAYQGKYHDQVVAQMAAKLRLMGNQVVTELPLCLEDVCARIDIVGREPGAATAFAIEVKTGEKPRFTPEQLAVYPHLRSGGALVTPNARALQVGLPTGVPLAPISGWLYYQKEPGTDPVVLPIP
jgi:hypothetical protein